MKKSDEQIENCHMVNYVMASLWCCFKEPRTYPLETTQTTKPISTEFTNMNVERDSSVTLHSSRSFKVITEQDFITIVRSSPKYRASILELDKRSTKLYSNTSSSSNPSNKSIRNPQESHNSVKPIIGFHVKTDM